MSTGLHRALESLAQTHSARLLTADDLMRAVSHRSSHRKAFFYIAGPVAVGVAVLALFLLPLLYHSDETVTRPARLSISPSLAAPSSSPSSSADQLVVTVFPRSGPPGTMVHIDATYCPSATRDFAVSFNADVNGPSAGVGLQAVRAISASIANGHVLAYYEIRSADNTRGQGAFFVQCASAVSQASFSVTDR
jgi:hypothetical protein